MVAGIQRKGRGWREAARSGRRERTAAAPTGEGSQAKEEAEGR